MSLVELIDLTEAAQHDGWRFVVFTASVPCMRCRGPMPVGGMAALHPDTQQTRCGECLERSGLLSAVPLHVEERVHAR